MATKVYFAGGGFWHLRHVYPNQMYGLWTEKDQISFIESLICHIRSLRRGGIGNISCHTNAIEELEELLAKLEKGARITDIKRI